MAITERMLTGLGLSQFAMVLFVKSLLARVRQPTDGSGLNQ
jgi:hypothetical protein